MTRRVFMKAGAAAVVDLGAVPRFLIRAAFAASENGNTNGPSGSSVGSPKI